MSVLAANIYANNSSWDYSNIIKMIIIIIIMVVGINK